MIRRVFFVDDLQNPIKVLEEIFRTSGRGLIQEAFRHSFFADPEKVRLVPVRFPDAARYSRQHYPGGKKGDLVDWNGRKILLDDNSRAQRAWAYYSGRNISRASGYGVRHIWGHPWNPDAFTAGWNLCYMPFWAGMLTEDQHPLPELKLAFEQASYDLYFLDNAVCSPPEFVNNPGIDLTKVLGDQPVLILGKANGAVAGGSVPLEAEAPPELVVRDIRARTRCSWSNLWKAVRVLQGQKGIVCGTSNVESTSKSIVWRMVRESGWNLDQLGQFVRTQLV